MKGVTNMAIDEVGLVIAGAGVVVTAVFSCLIWQANIQSAKAAKGAADAATESAKISKMMLDAQEEQKKSLRDQLRRDINKQCADIINILDVMIKAGITTKLMSKLPEEISTTNHELAGCFTEKEQQLVYYTVVEYGKYEKITSRMGNLSLLYRQNDSRILGIF